MDNLGGGGSQPMPTLPTLETVLPPSLQPQGMKPRNKNPRATFLGPDANANPTQASGNMGGKTLMGA